MLSVPELPINARKPEMSVYVSVRHRNVGAMAVSVLVWTDRLPDASTVTFVITPAFKSNGSGLLSVFVTSPTEKLTT